jgi:L-ascorbate metabolism protein UlaG (beta-lactamase superfamily)
MTVEEALEAVRDIHPKRVIPMHVGAGIGSLEDAERFTARSPVPAEVLALER